MSELIMIEPLADKPKHQTVEQWLNEVKTSTELDSVVSEEWISLNETRVLKVINRHSENVYAVHASKTFAIRFDQTAFPVLQGMLSTFKFTSP